MFPRFLEVTHSLELSADSALTNRRFVQSPSQNAALNPKRSLCPIVSIEGLLRLVTLVAQHRATQDSDVQEGAVCQNNPFPPASTANSQSTVASSTSCPTSAIDLRTERDDNRADQRSGAAGGTS